MVDASVDGASKELPRAVCGTTPDNGAGEPRLLAYEGIIARCDECVDTDLQIPSLRSVHMSRWLIFRTTLPIILKSAFGISILSSMEPVTVWTNRPKISQALQEHYVVCLRQGLSSTRSLEV
jgi:hypothetical protein